MNDKCRNWIGVFYPEDESHINALCALDRNGFNFCYILHNKDVFDDDEFDCDGGLIHSKGELKKPHYHVVIKLRSARYRKPLADELGIAEHYLEPCHDLRSSLLYLIHAGFGGYQYDLADVFGPLSASLKVLLESNDEADKVLALVELIDSLPSPSYKQLLIACCQNGLWSVFRKLGVGVKYLLDESFNNR